MQAQKRRPCHVVGTTVAACALLPAVLTADELGELPAISDVQLGQLRGGLDVGPMIANFAIERVVRIDGEVVARTLLVVDFSHLESGGLPTLQVIGDLANLIQVGPGNVAPAVDPQVIAHVAEAIADVAAAPTATPLDTIAPVGNATDTAAPLGLPLAADASASAVTATAGVTSGSEALFAAALTQAVEVATSDVSAVSDASPTPTPVSTPTAASTPASTPTPAPMTSIPAPPVTVPAASVGSTSAAVPAPLAETTSPALPAPATPVAPLTTSNVPATTSLVRTIGSTGQVVVVANLPDAAALATAIQNSAAQTRLETQTTISATLNSLALLQSGAMADALRQQILRSLGSP